jgi:guanosine-3',5'-bis(diphosphate) 3'-pyrophosphohydrolase
MPPPNTHGYDLVLEAAAFAARAHDGQRRKDGKTPYVSHVFRVCLILRDQFGFADGSMLMTALLHDTIEDTTTDFDDLEEHFGKEVAQNVASLTKNKFLPEATREEDYIERLRKAPWQVRACKLADMFDNLMDLPALPAAKRAKSLARCEQYLAALRPSPEPELRQPLAKVEQLLAEQLLAEVRQPASRDA